MLEVLEAALELELLVALEEEDDEELTEEELDEEACSGDIVSAPDQRLIRGCTYRGASARRGRARGTLRRRRSRRLSGSRRHGRARRAD